MVRGHEAGDNGDVLEGAPVATVAVHLRWHAKNQMGLSSETWTTYLLLIENHSVLHVYSRLAHHFVPLATRS